MSGHSFRYSWIDDSTPAFEENCYLSSGPKLSPMIPIAPRVGTRYEASMTLTIRRFILFTTDMQGCRRAGLGKTVHGLASIWGAPALTLNHANSIYIVDTQS